MNNVLQSLRDIAEAVMHAAKAGTLEQVLQRIANVAQQVVRARYAALGVPDNKGGLRFFKTVGMTPEEIARIEHPPRGHGLLGEVMNQRESLRLDRISDHPRSYGFPAHHPPMERFMGVPIQVGKTLFGMLYMCDRLDGLPFDEEDQWLVESLAGYAALAIAGVQLGEQQGRLILLEERERVAMELHDGIIQSLYAIGMQLQLMRLNDHHAASALGMAINDLDNVIEDIRRYILNLRASNYHKQTLHQSLLDVLARLHVPAQIQVEMDVPDTIPPFPAPVFEAVCQIAQEAISNVIRHAAATRVLVQATYGDGFRLLIRDDGRGFDLRDQNGHGDGLGLRNIQQRARLHGGRVQILTRPGGGTELTLLLPL